MYTIDPLSIATDGFVIGSPLAVSGSLSIATNGFLVVLQEEIIEVIVPPMVGSIGGWVSPIAFSGTKKKKKKITAKVVYDNKVYEESIIVEDITVKLSDVRVDVSENESKPRITITVMRD